MLNLYGSKVYDHPLNEINCQCCHFRSQEHKKLVGDQMAAYKGGRVFSEYFKLLSKTDGEKSPLVIK